MYLLIKIFLIVYFLLHSQPIKNDSSTPRLAVIDTVAQPSTLYAILFMAFIILITFPSRGGLPFSPKVFFASSNIYDLQALQLAEHQMAVGLLDQYINVTLSLESKLIYTIIS